MQLENIIQSAKHDDNNVNDNNIGGGGNNAKTAKMRQWYNDYDKDADNDWR